MMETTDVTCPTCFEVFQVVMPPPDELPAEMDYDCEVCCRPMVLVFDEGGCHAVGMDE
ncbi:MAG: CPXCG motif-containing cysteine-rich protein [Verrucomicrobiales bacterium]|nr:CPXCG motif-containing cysteine-rich protein [Verrucomicrobiota bacterium JB025]